MSFRKLSLVVLLLGLPLSAAVAEELTQTLKRISEAGVINIGYRVDQTPLSFDRGDNVAAGYSVDLCKLVAGGVVNRLKMPDLKIKFVPVTATSRFEDIQSGKIDILCGATTKTLRRMEKGGFTQPTFMTGGGLLSNADAPVGGVDALAGKRVAVVTNTTTIVALEAVLKARKIDAEVVAVDSTAKGMDLLESGQVHAFSADQVVLIGQVISRGGRDRYALADELFSFEPFALGIARGDADFQLVADRVLSELNRSGKILEVYRQWFGSFGKQPPEALLAMYQLNATPR